LRDSQKIVGGRDQKGAHLHSLATAKAGPADTAYGLHPAEYLLDAFADALAYGIAGMARGTRINGGAAPAPVILCHVRSDSQRATVRNELAVS
jgi:hypothetical protein